MAILEPAIEVIKRQKAQPNSGGVVLGRSTNGWTKWKNKDGVTLDELKRK